MAPRPPAPLVVPSPTAEAPATTPASPLLAALTAAVTAEPDSPAWHRGWSEVAAQMLPTLEARCATVLAREASPPETAADLAASVVSDCFVAWTAMARRAPLPFVHDGGVLAYATTVAARHLAARARRPAAEARAVPLDEGLAATLAVPDATVDDAEARRVGHRDAAIRNAYTACLRTLSPRDAAVAEQVCVHGASLRDVASAWGRASRTGAARARTRAMAALRAHLAPFRPRPEKPPVQPRLGPVRAERVVPRALASLHPPRPPLLLPPLPGERGPAKPAPTR